MSGSGLFAAFEMTMSSPASTKLAMSEEPPAAMYGRVRPVSGMTSVMPPTTVKTWKAIVNTSPAASSLPKPSLMRIAVIRPEAMMTRYRTRIASSPVNPSSSPSDE